MASSLGSPGRPSPPAVLGSPVWPSPPAVLGSPVWPSPPAVLGSPVRQSPSAVLGSPAWPSPPSVLESPVWESHPAVLGFPVKLSPPAVLGSPVKPSPPVVLGSPVKLSPPAVLGSPVEPSPPVVLGSPVKLSPPTVLGSTVKQSPPVELGSPVKLSPPVVLGSPVKPSPSAVLESPAILLSPIIVGSPTRPAFPSVLEPYADLSPIVLSTSEGPATHSVGSLNTVQQHHDCLRRMIRRSRSEDCLNETCRTPVARMPSSYSIQWATLHDTSTDMDDSGSLSNFMLSGEVTAADLGCSSETFVGKTHLEQKLFKAKLSNMLSVASEVQGGGTNSPKDAASMLLTPDTEVSPTCATVMLPSSPFPEAGNGATPVGSASRVRRKPRGLEACRAWLARVRAKAKKAMGRKNQKEVHDNGGTYVYNINLGTVTIYGEPSPSLSQ